MLDLTSDRAKIENGQSVLDLGCGWGAFSLYAAARFPSSEITGVSNSHSQRQHIEEQARQRGLTAIRAGLAAEVPKKSRGAVLHDVYGGMVSPADTARLADGRA